MLKVVVYSTDSVALNLIKSLLENKADIIIPELDKLELGHLVLIDHAYRHSQAMLDKVRQSDDGVIIAVMSFNPFAISQFFSYNIDAILSKPLSAESVQALFVGVEARSGSLST